MTDPSAGRFDAGPPGSSSCAGRGPITLATRSRSRVAMGTSAFGGAAILGAAFNGASFLDFNQDFSSVIMAGLFAVAIGNYVVGLAAPALHGEATATSDSASPRL